ncbi:bacteriohemerythrin [Limisalsivibrio acetivorans]|uniref:bacteriohemerythrin n=1 Tax=Limisalsivibrio acetivorans TaxID=1304888 RepID=UPI0003B5C801|nr:hemerythrin family protein [Limisalsivibrio acetivorans]
MSIKWTSELITGIDFIDRQHKAFVTIMYRLLEAMKNGEGKEELPNTLRFMEFHAIKALKAEEEFMEKIGYPGADFHFTQHKHFHEELAALKDMYSQNGYTVSLPLTFQRKMGDWLHHHVAKTDVILGDYVSSNKKIMEEIS